LEDKKKECECVFCQAKEYPEIDMEKFKKSLNDLTESLLEKSDECPEECDNCESGKFLCCQDELEEEPECDCESEIDEDHEYQWNLINARLKFYESTVTATVNWDVSLKAKITLIDKYMENFDKHFPKEGE